MEPRMMVYPSQPQYAQSQPQYGQSQPYGPPQSYAPPHGKGGKGKKKKGGAMEERGKVIHNLEGNIPQ